MVRMKIIQWTRRFGLIPAMAVFVCLLGVPTAAKANLVANGSFEATSLTGPGGFLCGAGSTSSTCASTVTDWTATCSSQGCLSTNSPASLVTGNGSAFNGGFGLAGSPVNSPDGGYYIADDGDPTYSSLLSQTITGLTQGQAYTVSFYQAGASQGDISDPTSADWQVSLGGETEQSPTMNTPADGFTPWSLQTLTFVADGTSALLSFLSQGTPSGEPPLALLDGVSVNAVPEPATLGLLCAGSVGALVARRRRRT